MGDLKYLLPILVAVILVWITYLVINFVATIIKTKKKDDNDPDFVGFELI